MCRFINAPPHALLALLAACATNALAWGAEGHRLIAEWAQRQLTPAAVAEVDRLLALQSGATMATVSTWADEKRALATAPLHYVNLPEGTCDDDRRRDCPDGRCVVEAITAKLTILRSSAPDTKRLAALKWVIHLVADVHQPLHVGLASDRGGNLYQVRAFGRGSNLHAVWETELIRWRPGVLVQLRQDMGVKAVPTAAHPTPAGRAAQSSEVRQRAGFYSEGRRINDEYAQQWDAELVNRLSAAGTRLADVLNQALGAK